MDDPIDGDSENILKTLCCTCLSRERKLYQLCRLVDGVNNLYSLLSYDQEAYKEVFYKETASLHVCWECKAILSRISLFRHQACSVQKQLTEIADERAGIDHLKSLSRLQISSKDGYDVTFDSSDDTDNFIDCGPASASSDDDVPLSALYNSVSGVSDDKKSSSKQTVRLKKKKRTKTSENKSYFLKYKKYFTTSKMTYEEMLKTRDAMKISLFENAPYKCDSCVEVFKSDIAWDEHNKVFHTMKENHSKCSICLSFIPTESVESHMSSHLIRQTCKLCGHDVCEEKYAMDHLRTYHRDKYFTKMTRKQVARVKKKSEIENSTLHGFKCPECNKSFDTKNKRWKHVQRHHREGFACDKCGKRFAFRSNLSRHERLHQSPPPRQQCAICHKLIRCDLLKIHAEIHTTRETCECRACNKTFVSRASYEHHLKYTRAHALKDILKHKCPECDKGYRSRGELIDHVNYQHRNKTSHKCPECGKALATRRCITRHVRRAHRGLKENARDKICQQCGKAFRDKKGLREHEFIHTGERPLSCELCGVTFRQTASLYTHKKRVHKMYSERKSVELLDDVTK